VEELSTSPLAGPGHALSAGRQAASCTQLTRQRESLRVCARRIEPGTYVFWHECCFYVQVVSAQPLTRSFSLPVIIAMRIVLIAILSETRFAVTSFNADQLE